MGSRLFRNSRRNSNAQVTVPERAVNPLGCSETLPYTQLLTPLFPSLDIIPLEGARVGERGGEDLASERSQSRLVAQPVQRILGPLVQLLSTEPHLNPTVKLTGVRETII